MQRREFLKLLGSVPMLPLAVGAELYAEPAHALFLGDFTVAGFHYHQGMLPQVSRYLAAGAELLVERDHGNPYDAYAVRILTVQSSMLGYLPRNQNRAVAAMADQGVSLTARITGYREDAAPWERLAISLWAAAPPAGDKDASHRRLA